MDFKKSVTTTLIVLLVLSAYLMGEYRNVARFDRLNSALEDIRSDDVGGLRERVADVVNENGRLKLQLRELWFLGMPELVVKKILASEYKGCLFDGSSFAISNTYYGKVPYVPAGYLTYSYDKGTLLFDRNGEMSCFDKATKKISCDELCKQTEVVVDGSQLL